MITQWYRGTKSWLAQHWRRVVILVGAGLLVIVVAVQLAFPAGLLLPFARVDGVSMGLKSKLDAAHDLDERYTQLQAPLYLGDADMSYQTPTLAELGISVTNQARMNNTTYPWYLRLIPTSILWGQFVLGVSEPVYSYDNDQLQRYVAQAFGECVIAARDASVKVVDGQLEVDEGSVGATCQVEDVQAALAQARPALDQPAIRVPAHTTPQLISAAMVRQLAATLQTKLANDIVLVVGIETITIPKEVVVGWLEFVTVDGQLTYKLNPDRANEYLAQTLSPKVAMEAGVTTITTSNFTEVSRQTGLSGQTLDVSATLESFQRFLLGQANEVVAITKTIEPSIVYDRSYTPNDTGLAALIENFAKSHGGTYAVSLVELSGATSRRATYRADVQYITASTYKLFVAYSTLLRVESGAWQWTDLIYGGRNLAKCFDDMIVLSNNECAHALLNKIGYATITNEAKAIGATRTSFVGNSGIKSTANDEALLLSLLYTGQILTQQSSRDRLIDAMKRNVYRQGIPKGLTGITVADKVGFLDALLHDAAIVYSPTGTYVLIILTEGSSWANIADLARQIQALRIQ